MKKLFLMSMLAFATVCMLSCGKDDNGDNGGGDDPDPEPPVEVEGKSVQAVNKTVLLPAANFPAVDVSVEQFTLREGYYKATLNDEEFDGDKFAEGVLLPADGEIKIEQGGKTLVTFAPKTGGAGTKIRLTGVHSTSDLASKEGVGRGVYTLYVIEEDKDSEGFLIGYNVYTGGNVANRVNKIEFEGGVAYRLRRDHNSGEDAKDAEGWAKAPVDLSGGFDCHPNQAISLYAESEWDKPADQQVPFISASPKPSSGQIPIIFQHMIKEEDANGLKYYIQGNGKISCYFIVGDGCNYEKFDFDWEEDVVGNAMAWARAFAPQAQFKLYFNTDKTIEGATEASDEICQQFVSNDGVDTGDKWLILKLMNPEEGVNTQENMIFFWKRKANAEDTWRIRWEGLAYDAQNKYFGVTGGQTVRCGEFTKPAPEE